MATNGTHGRLIRLEERIGPPGCGTCRFWGPAAHAVGDGQPRPERCPDCRRAVPILLVRRYRIEHDVFGEAPTW